MLCIHAAGVLRCSLNPARNQFQTSVPHRRHWQLVRVQAAPGIPRIAIDVRLQVDLADPLERADEKYIHRHQVAGMFRFDVLFAKLRAEALQQTDLSPRSMSVCACSVHVPGASDVHAWSIADAGSTRRVHTRAHLYPLQNQFLRHV